MARSTFRFLYKIILQREKSGNLSRAVIAEGNLQAIHFVRLVTSLLRGNYPREMRVLKLAVITAKNIKVGRYYERRLSTGDVRGGRNSFWKKGKDDFCVCVWGGGWRMEGKEEGRQRGIGGGGEGSMGGGWRERKHGWGWREGK